MCSPAAPATSFGLLRPDLREEPPTFLGAGMAQPGMGDASLAQVLPPLFSRCFLGGPPACPVLSCPVYSIMSKPVCD